MDKAFGAPRIARITAVALVAVLGGGGSVGPAETDRCRLPRCNRYSRNSSVISSTAPAIGSGGRHDLGIAQRAKIRTERWAPIGSTVAALTRGAWQFVVAVKHRRELRGLIDLDDHLLADIGLTRSDPHAAHSASPWRDPTGGLSGMSSGM